MELIAKDLRFAYDQVQVLHGVDLTAKPGKVTCVIGRNGVGKTTLMKCLMGRLPLGSGSLSLGGIELGRLPSHARARLGLSLVPQGREIFPTLSIEENLRMGLEARRDGAQSLPESCWQAFPVLKEMRKRAGGDLSGGQQQQLAIARALAGGPRVLLLDEPTEGIQPSIIKDIGRVLRSLAREQGLAIVLVEQYLDFVEEVGDEFILINRGRVELKGHTHALKDKALRQKISV